MRFAIFVFVFTAVMGVLPNASFGLTPAPVAPQPTWAVGDTWTYRAADGTPFTLTVRGVTSDHYSVERNGGGRITVIQVGFDFSPSWFARFQWPLQMKKQWSFNTTGRSGKSETNSYTTTLTVGTYEAMTVPAGTFDAFRVNGRQCNNTKKDCGDFLTWYAPRVKNFMKIMWVTRGYWSFSGKSTELLSYRVH